MAIQFPDPSDNVEFTTKSGISYYWDETSSSWVMLSGQSVTRNYVDSRDQLRYRRDGADFIFGDVKIKEDNDLTSQTTVTITTEGKLSLAKESTLNFSPVGGTGDGGSISFGASGSEQEIINIGAEFVGIRRTLRFNTDDTKKLNRVEVNGHPEIILFDISQQSSSSTPSDYTIRIPRHRNSSFVVKGYDSNSDFRVRGDGQVVVSHQKASAFVVKSTEIDYAFRVDPDSHKIMASKEYSDALKTGGGNVTNPDGSSTYQLMTEENLLVTKGYVDSLSEDIKGAAVIADRESDAKPGGFWRSGTNLYWKL